MKFWNIFLDLCNKKGKSPNGVAKELGISSGSITWWKKGERNPGASALKKISEYFNVSVGYLLGYETQPEQTEQKEKSPLPNTDKEDVILELFKNMPLDKQKEVILEYIAKADEDKQRAIIQALISALGNQG